MTVIQAGKDATANYALTTANLILVVSMENAVLTGIPGLFVCAERYIPTMQMKKQIFGTLNKIITGY